MYSITFTKFLGWFRIMEGDKVLRKLHDEGELDMDDMHLIFLEVTMFFTGR
jgi:hypothetical protein